MNSRHPPPQSRLGRGKLATLVIAAVLVVLELPAPKAQERVPEFILGVLRRDGIVTPFATFDGRRWSNRWPDDIRNRELPIALEDVPKSWWGLDAPPQTLAVWRDGARAGEVALTGVTTTALMCAPRITLRSNYKPATPAPPPFERPYPKDGLVVSGNVPIERIESVQPGSTVWNQVLKLLPADFDRQETIASRAFTSWAHPMKPEQRKLVPLTIEALYRAPTRDAGWTAHYVEVVRQYPPGPQDTDGCGLATYANGWVLVGPKNEARVALSARVTYCDRKGVSYMLPFGLIRANDHIYWIFQFSGFEDEWYEVAEPARRGVDSHAAYHAGRCPQ